MKYAIIAAGEGSRLAHEGVQEPKPMVVIGGERLVDRLVRVFADNGADGITVAYRRGMGSVASHLENLQAFMADKRNLPIEAVGVETSSSMHSLMAISEKLKGDCFCLTTVDTVFDESAFKAYIATLRSAVEDGTADGVMAVTKYIDDEKPLYVATDTDMNITAFLDNSDACRYVSAGIYGLTPSALDILCKCICAGESRMRNFQRALLRGGMRLKAFDIGKAFDIDHASDIVKAEQFITSCL